jgi:site-specific recombinase XerD
MKVAILGGLISPKETTMFEQLFTQRAAVARHHSSPFAAERLSYLSHLMEAGHSSSRLYSVAHLLMAIAQHLPLNRTEIARAEIEASAEAWARTTHRSALCRHTGKREFVFHATKWLQLLGRLQEPRKQQPFALEMDAFLRYGQQERGLAPSTLARHRRCLAEFLIRLGRQNKTLRDVTLDDISAHIQIVAQRKLKRTSISHHVAALRAFFRYAHSRGWCRAGLAAIDAPRIYRLESLPRGPAWSDVQRLLAACAGDTPCEIRDHAMLLVIAVYGVRSGEVRHLLLEDIDWEREIVRIRRSKQRKSQHYPLVREVGAAILRYLREVRPKCTLREVFLTRVQPYRTLTATGFGTMVRKRLQQLGLVLPCYGPHALRHSCATHLLAEGVSLKEIADHLGHVSLAATQMYAKVDLPALHEVGDLPLSGLVTFAVNSERAATPIQLRGSIEALRGVAAISLGGLL